MIINPDGLVLTNNHVIAGATKITATDVATGKTYPATVVGYDKTADIALIQLRGATGLHTIPVGNSATVRTGDPVVALGNAEGQGTIIPAAGQVTATGQTITAADQGGTAGEFTLSGRAMRNVRQMASRAGRHGYAAEVRRVRDIPRRELDQIRTAAASWRGGPVERGFSMALGRVGPGSRGSSCSQADATRRASRWPRCRPRPSWPGPSWKPAATPGASRGGSAPPGHPAGPGTARHRGRGWQRMP